MYLQCIVLKCLFVTVALITTYVQRGKKKITEIAIHKVIIICMAKETRKYGKQVHSSYS